jgi:predicted kinase
MFPIGPSGAGKSTFFKKYVETMPDRRVSVFSFDALRLEWYNTTDYAEAFHKSVEDKTFEQRAKNVFIELVKSKVDIYVDNTNLGARRRAFFVNEARRRGYITTGIILHVPEQLVLGRQFTRGDKNVPAASVSQMYYSVQVPSLDEMDIIGQANTSGTL